MFIPFTVLRGDVVTAVVPFEDDPTRSKPRPALVRAVRGDRVVVQGFYTNDWAGRLAVRALPGRGLDKLSYLDPTPVIVHRSQISKYRGRIVPGEAA